MELETLATQLNGEVWHTGGGIMCVRVCRGRWTLTIGLAQSENGFVEADNDGWDFDFDDEYVDSEYFDNREDFDGSNGTSTLTMNMWIANTSTIGKTSMAPTMRRLSRPNLSGLTMNCLARRWDCRRTR